MLIIYTIITFMTSRIFNKNEEILIKKEAIKPINRFFAAGRKARAIFEIRRSVRRMNIYKTIFPARILLFAQAT